MLWEIAFLKQEDVQMLEFFTKIDENKRET